MVERMKLTILMEILRSLSMITTSAKGITLLKLNASFKIALIISPFMYLINRISAWSIQNQDYIAIVLSAIAIDHLLGTIRHIFYDRDFTFKQNGRGFIIKVMLVVLVGILFEQLNHLAKDYTMITSYTSTILRLTVFLYPFGSAIGNSRIISNGKFPPDNWYKRFEKFIDNINKKQ